MHVCSICIWTSLSWKIFALLNSLHLLKILQVKNLSLIELFLQICLLAWKLIWVVTAATGDWVSIGGAFFLKLQQVISKSFRAGTLWQWKQMCGLPAKIRFYRDTKVSSGCYDIAWVQTFDTSNELTVRFVFRKVMIHVRPTKFSPRKPLVTTKYVPCHVYPMHWLRDKDEKLFRHKYLVTKTYLLLVHFAHFAISKDVEPMTPFDLLLPPLHYLLCHFVFSSPSISIPLSLPLSLPLSWKWLPWVAGLAAGSHDWKL